MTASRNFFLFICQLIFLSCYSSEDAPLNESPNAKVTQLPPHVLQPKILITLLVRNKAHYLPYVLGHLEKLNYPKHRLGLFIRSDHNSDNSSDIINLWLDKTRHLYRYVNYTANDTVKTYPNEKVPYEWTDARFIQVMQLKQEALNTARKIWADFIFYVDADVILFNPDTLNDLISIDETLIGPMLNCTNSETFSNFWGDITEKGYYKRSSNYFDIKFRRIHGIFPVAVIHSAFLINLNHKASRELDFTIKDRDYSGPIDDIIIFAKSVLKIGLKFYLRNDKLYGYFAAPEENNVNLEDDKDILDHALMQILHDQQGTGKASTSPHLPVNLPPKSKLGFDEIYMINLKRRPDRRAKMEYCFDILGIDAKYIDAVDGRKLNDTYLNKLGVKQLKGYADPYHKRNLKFGEIGCFLSHYYIWEEMLEKKYEKVLIFEDDIRFSVSFVKMLHTVLREADKEKPDWDLIYVGRKRMFSNEQFVKTAKHLVYPDYTYWTLSYIINRSGVTKLLAQKPLGKMIAVDEFLPIMFKKHPREEWAKHFQPQNVVGISMEPLLVEPSHYTGEPFYFSDTEDTKVIDFGKTEL